MTYRGDDEPEYIDDDEYYDPDEYHESKTPDWRKRVARASKRRRSNILGGGFRSSNDKNADRPAAPRGKLPSGKVPPDSPPKGMNRADSGTRPAAKNSASSAGAAGRRVRLADAAAYEPRESSPSRNKTNAPGGGRLKGLRLRFAGGIKTAAQAAAIASGVRQRFDSLRNRSRTKDDSRSPSQDAKYAKQSAPPGVGRANKSPRSSRAKNAPTRSSIKPSGRADRGADQTQSAPTPNRTRAGKTPKLESADWLDLDRKLDLAGVGLVFGAVALFFSTLSQEHAAISAVHNFISQLLGWGAMAAPIAMFAVGMWLIIRHFGDQAPSIDPIRLAGIALAFVSVLTFFQYLNSFGYAAAFPAAMQAQQMECAARTTGQNACEQEIARLAECQMAITSGCLRELVQYAYQRGQGGGYAGAWLYLTLVSNFTEIGGFVIMVMMLTFAAMMITRLSMAEIAAACVGIGRGFRSRLAQSAAKSRAQRLQTLTEQTMSLRVSKPPPAQLPLSDQPARALPEPAADSNMPIPPMRIDKRDILIRRGHQTLAQVEPNQESVRLTASGPAAAADQRHSGVFERLFGRGKSKTPPQSAPPPKQTPASRPAVKDNSRHSPTRPEDIPSHKTEKPMTAASQSMPQIDRPLNKPRKPASSALVSPPRRRPRWRLPDYRSLLSSGSAEDFDHEQLLNRARLIEKTLASFGAPGRVVEINTGPVITQFGVEPNYLTARSGKKNRVKVSAIAQLDKDLQLALGAKSIRVEAPVPGKGYVGVEVPNPGAALVSLRDVMESDSFQKIKSPLAIALGMSVDGAPVSGDLTRMPHLLIAGTTGSGKSVCVNAIINSIVVTNSPETVKFIMVDPKRVELTGYNGLPHLIAPVVVELERVVGVLKWVTREMDERYKKFSNIGARNLIDYNKNRDASLESMPYIVVIIDELADLMMLAPEETERSITRIAALARATGIHLVIATQRPSVDVVTGLIKANFPARIAFAVAGSVDSRVILDQPGAERLLGTGDMLYLSGDSPAPQRLQGVFVSDDEINSISRYWMTQRLGIKTVKPLAIEPEPPPQAAVIPSSAAEPSGQTSFWDMPPRDMTGMAVESKTGNPDPQEDELYQTAVDMVRSLDKASISLLQRRLRIGYTRAARLVDMMEERGVVGPAKEGSSKPRDVIAE